MNGPPRRWVVLDALAVLALVGLAELALANTFEGGDYLVVAGVAAVLGLLVAVLTARLPSGVLVGAVPVVALVFGGPVALHSKGLGLGVPGAATLADVLQGTLRGWGELLTTLPWVDLSGSPAMVPFLLGYLGAVLAGAVAFRTRSAGAPLVPLLAALAVALLVRRPDGTGSDRLDWYPVAFAALAIGWLVVRSLRVAPGASAAGAGHGRVARTAVATSLVAAALLVAVPVTIPFSASGAPVSEGVALREHRAALVDVTALDSPLRRFRTFTDQGPGSLENVHDKVLFTVRGAPAGSRVRMVTLDRYDGREWLPGNDTEPGTADDSFLRIDSRVDNPRRGRVVRAQVSVTKAYRSAWMPTVGSLTSLQLIFADPREQRGEMRYNLATSTAVLPTGVGNKDPYEFTSVVPAAGVDASTPGWDGPVQPVVGLHRLDAFLPAVLDANLPPMRKVFVLAGYLRDQGRYSDGARPGEQRYLPGQDLDRLVDGFLLGARPVGDDEQYAAAMALLANRVGVPARVVVGAVLPHNGKVRGEDVHGWVELRVADGSWRTLPTRAFMSRTPPVRTLPPAPPPLPPSKTSPSERPEQPRTQDQPKSRHHADGATGSVLHLLPWLALLVLALVVPALKGVRRHRRRTRGRTADRIAGGWAELVDRAGDLGIPVSVQASRPAQARVLVLPGGEALSQAADDGVFAAEEPSEAAVEAFWDQMLAERRELGEGRRLVRRLWAPFNPASLWRRRTGRSAAD